MKLTTIKILAIVLGGSVIASSCSKSNPVVTPPTTVYYQQQDQMGRPAINTVFNSAADKDAFNTTTPSAMGAAFQAKFQARLLALNPFYTVNVLVPAMDAATFSGALATDVLTASTTGPTKFFTSTTDYLTGRGLADDVIDAELILIFGGPTGALNPQLTSDHVDANDKAFLVSFPYLATPF